MIVPVLDAFNGFVNHERGYAEPFAWSYRIPVAILDFDLKPRRVEDAVDEVFQHHAANIGKLVALAKVADQGNKGVADRATLAVPTKEDAKNIRHSRSRSCRKIAQSN